MANQDPRVVVIAREIPITRFNGFVEDAQRANTFKEEIESAWAAQPHLDNARKLALLLQNVGPIVRDELKCQTNAIQNDPAQALQCIVAIFGERRTPAELKDAMRQTRQLPGETVRIFSHRAKSAFNALVSRQTTLAVPLEDEATLRDHFARSVSCPTLSRYLTEKVTLEPAATFLEVREVAIRWARDEDTPSAATSAVAVSATPAPQPDNSRLDRLERLMTTLVEMMTTKVATPPPAPAPLREPSRREPSRREPRGVNSRGEQVCFGCGQPGHRIARCPERQGNDSSRR